MLIHGDIDKTVKWEGDDDFASVPVTFEHWATLNQCASGAQVVQDSGLGVEYSSYGNCQNEIEVKLVKVMGGEHEWPGGSGVFQLPGLNEKNSQIIDTSALIWDFFKDKTR